MNYEEYKNFDPIAHRSGVFIAQGGTPISLVMRNIYFPNLKPELAGFGSWSSWIGRFCMP